MRSRQGLEEAPDKTSRQASPSTHMDFQGNRGHRSYVVEFWCVILLPWFLDFATTNRVFTSVLAASVWGLAVVLSAARLRTRDFRFRRLLGFALVVVELLWVGAWIFSFFEKSPSGSELVGLPRWLMLTHAGLLAAGAGMVLINFFASLVWIYQNAMLKKSSWERREQRLWLPSLEALGKLASGSVDFALASWGLGFLLAILNAILSWSNQSGAMGWLKDPKVIVTAALWLWLAVAFQVAQIVSKNSKKLFRFYIVFSLIFFVTFLWTVLGNSSFVHERLKWF